MSWAKGTIREFRGKKTQHRDVRKIQTAPNQDFNRDMFFFHVSLARRAGYPDSALVEGAEIWFEPDPHADRPKVLGFKPYEKSAKTGPSNPGGTKFLNPYHFIPLAPPLEESLVEAKAYLEKAPLHDRFAGLEGNDPRYSGRVVCRLTTEGPMVVGSSQSKESENEETKVQPFELPDPEAPEDSSHLRPAIPGSTLRGLISSIVEPASCSAMRVLPDTTYSRRAHHKHDALSAVGRVEIGVDNEPKLRPLTQSLEKMQRESCAENECRVFLGRYLKTNQGLQVDSESFLGRVAPRSHSSSNPDEFWYLDFASCTWHIKVDKKRNESWRLGLDTSEDPLTEEAWEKLPQDEQARYTRGVLMVFGLDGSKAGNLPRMKKYEYFLPFPEPAEDEAKGEVLLDIEPEALERFDTAAKAAASLSRGGDVNDLPYLPKGRKRDLKLADGDLVYYETDQSGKVSRLSFSAIWRFLVPESLHQAVRGVNENLVPFHSDRSELTLAERLFGFVEDKGKRALCGRVRFSHGLVERARPEKGWYMPEVLLKVLASAKPPSPALYFGNHGYLSKGALNLGEHKPQGRKVYLHHREEDVDGRCYETAKPNDDKRHLKLKVKPLRKGTRFLFHVDFHNLTDEELGHLLYALRPTEPYRHKLGLGKPLGLGRVVIDLIGLFFVDRRSCYASEGLFGPKYKTAELPHGIKGWSELPQGLEDRYRHELEAVRAQGDAADSYPGIEELVEHVREGIPEKVRWAIELVGDPASVERVGAEVTYPVVQGQDSEGEHFQWFVENDKGDGPKEALDAIEPGGELPTLSRHPKRSRRS